MAQQTASASVAIKVARQNYYATLALNVTGSLSQAWNSETQKPTPDWSEEANQPTITPKIVCGTSYLMTAVNWYRDGNLIASLAGVKDESLYKIDSTTGALTIIDNLISAANLDPDTFTCEVTINVNNVNYTIQRAVSATLLPLSSNGYVLLVTATNGTALDGETTETTLKATVYYAGSGTSTTSVSSYKWYKGGTEISGANSETYKVTRDAVDWEQLFRVEALDADGNVLAIGGIQITDQADNYALEATVDSDVSESKAATVQLVLRKRETGASEWTDFAQDATYKAYIYDVADTDQTALSSGTLTGGKGSFTVTMSQMTAANIESGMIEVVASWS